MPNDPHAMGKLARARRILNTVENLIDLCSDDQVFDTRTEMLETQALVDALRRSRGCAANIMARLGDASGYAIRKK